MTNQTENRLAEHHIGKVILHLCCMRRTGHFQPYWSGVVREFRKMLRGQPAL